MGLPGPSCISMMIGVCRRSSRHVIVSVRRRRDAVARTDQDGNPDGRRHAVGIRAHQPASRPSAATGQFTAGRQRLCQGRVNTRMARLSGISRVYKYVAAADVPSISCRTSPTSTCSATRRFDRLDDAWGSGCRALRMRSSLLIHDPLRMIRMIIFGSFIYPGTEKPALPRPG